MNPNVLAPAEDAHTVEVVEAVVRVANRHQSGSGGPSGAGDIRVSAGAPGADWHARARGQSAGFDEELVTLADVDHREPIVFVYEYDFGDGCDHIVELEEHFAETPSPKAARCIDGARRPPGDVGGAHGYMNFLQIMADPHPPRASGHEAPGGRPLDPEWFDRELSDRDV